MPPPGTFTFHLDPDMDAALRAMASLTGQSVSDLVRDAVRQAVTEFVESGAMEREMTESAKRLRAAAQVLQEHRPARPD